MVPSVRWCILQGVLLPSLAFDPLVAFDVEIRECFTSSFMQDLTDSAWQQGHLSLKYGGLGLRPVSLHSCAAYIASVCATSGVVLCKITTTPMVLTLLITLVSQRILLHMSPLCHHLFIREPFRDLQCLWSLLSASCLISCLKSFFISSFLDYWGAYSGVRFELSITFRWSGG